jgi:hypothetical protein
LYGQETAAKTTAAKRAAQTPPVKKTAAPAKKTTAPR